MSELVLSLLVSLAAILVCVGVHFEGLLFASWIVKQIGYRRLRVAVVVTIAILLHLIEIVIFAVGWWLIARSAADDIGFQVRTFADAVYFSVITYTTVGYGDIVPIGLGRMLAGIEALIGLVLIAWTASFTFYEMQRNWGPASEHRHR